MQLSKRRVDLLHSWLSGNQTKAQWQLRRGSRSAVLLRRGRRMRVRRERLVLQLNQGLTRG